MKSMSAEQPLSLTPRDALLSSLLLPGESVTRTAMISNAIYWKALAMLVLTVVTALFAVTLALYFLVIAAVLAVLAFMTQKYLLLAATSHRVILFSGIFYQETVQMPYNRIESVETVNTLLGSLLGYSNIILTGMGGKRVMIPYVSDAWAFAEQVNFACFEQKNPRF